MTRRQRRANLLAALLGLTATACTILAHLLGYLDRFELFTLDLRFRYANALPQDPRLVPIDIDDRSLELVGRWPWDRDVQAALIGVPAELGARAVLVDITWVEPQHVREVVAADPDIVPATSAFGEFYKAYPDDELIRALAQAGNAYLAYHFTDDRLDRRTTRANLEQSEDFQRAVRLLSEQDTADPTELAARLRIPEVQARWMLTRARAVAALAREPTIGESELAARLSLPPERVAEVYERARKAALRRFIQQCIAEDPTLREQHPKSVVRQIYSQLSDRPFENETPIKTALIAAYRELLGYELTVQRPLAGAAAVGSIAVAVEGLAPVYFPLARAARRCGFVVFEPDEDGVTRRLSVFARHSGHVLTQLAFAMACDELGLDQFRVERGARELVLTSTRDPKLLRRLQLDEFGRMFVPWVAAETWDEQFAPHVKASALIQVQARRAQVARNQAAIRRLQRLALDGPMFDPPDELAVTDAAIDAASAELRAKRLAGRTELLADQEQQLAGLQAARDAAVRARTALLQQQSAEAPGADTHAAEDDRRDRRAALDEIAVFEAANARLEQEVADTLARLRPLLADKLCLIGYTATSLADATPVPTIKRAPGVIAHANLLNGLLTDHLVRWSTLPVNIALIGLAGLLATVISIYRSPRAAVMQVSAAALLFVLIAGWWLFYQWTYWVVLTAPLIAMLTSYFTIAVYYYLFVDRQRRQLATALGQYTSKAIANQVAEDADLCRKAETREVTVIFTDLRGFTQISERIGAERTQRVLNLCLERLTEVLLRHEALINKFMGDGIFAFWNPVIYSQPNHAELACRAALDLQSALAALIEEQRAAGGDEVFGELVMRVGLATGHAVVGPCGSEYKYDYTCIGDSVNVAARLESANKFYGTLILVNDVTREQVGDRFVFRGLGGVQVKGKRQPVQVYELLGVARAVPRETIEYAAACGRAIALFQQREWTAAQDALAQCLTRRPDDLAAQRYADAAARNAHSPPPADWNGALEILEK